MDREADSLPIKSADLNSIEAWAVELRRFIDDVIDVFNLEEMELQAPGVDTEPGENDLVSVELEVERI